MIFGRKRGTHEGRPTKAANVFGVQRDYHWRCPGWQGPVTQLEVPEERSPSPSAHEIELQGLLWW